MLIDSRVSFGEKLYRSFTNEEIKNEPMLFNCDGPAAMELGGSLTHAFVATLPGDWLGAPDLIIDSRVHMLMPGWFPCIPGYHHDDVPRSRADGQPNYETPEYRSEHVMCLVNADVCPTAFAVGALDFTVPPLGTTIYEQWHPDVESAVKAGVLTIVSVPDSTLAYFDDRTWHQGTAAVKGGWRWFIRASRNTGRKPTNELRRQVQVYLANPMQGW